MWLRCNKNAHGSVYHMYVTRSMFHFPPKQRTFPKIPRFIDCFVLPLLIMIIACTFNIKIAEHIPSIKKKSIELSQFVITQQHFQNGYELWDALYNYNTR